MKGCGGGFGSQGYAVRSQFIDCFHATRALRVPAAIVGLHSMLGSDRVLARVSNLRHPPSPWHPSPELRATAGGVAAEMVHVRCSFGGRGPACSEARQPDGSGSGERWCRGTTRYSR